MLNIVVAIYVNKCVTVYSDIQRERERERERKKEVVASIVTAAWRSRSARGRCLYASIVVTFSLIVYSAACGLPWFFPHLGFHVNICVSSLPLLIFCFLCINRLLGCGRVQLTESFPHSLVVECKSKCVYLGGLCEGFISSSYLLEPLYVVICVTETDSEETRY